MATADTRKIVTEYTRVLRSFGLSLSEIGRLHGVDSEGALDPFLLGAAIRDDGREVSPDGLHLQLLETLAQCDRGFVAERSYWNRLPTVQIGEVLDAAGYRFGVRTTDGHGGVCTTQEGPIDIGLWQTDGGPVCHTSFEYPDTPLGDDNYPALIAAVDDDLLDGTGLTFVRLDDRIADWEFLLLPTDLLDTLQDRYGNRIEWHGKPLLSAHQPADFVDDLPEALGEEFDAHDADSGLTRPEATFEEVSESTSMTVEDVSFGHGDADEPSASSLANADDPLELVTDGSGAGAVATDEEYTSVPPELLADIDADLDPSPASETDDDTSEWHTEDGSRASQGSVDDVFDHLERSAATQPVEADVDEDHHVPSSEVLDRIDHENAGENSRVEDGFVWVDPEELTATPWAVHDAMTRG